MTIQFYGQKACISKANALSIKRKIEKIMQFLWLLLSNLFLVLIAFFFKIQMLEVGAGLGISGLTAAIFADHVLLTDYTPTVLFPPFFLLSDLSFLFFFFCCFAKVVED
jgi:uncharacterized membrane protein